MPFPIRYRVPYIVTVAGVDVSSNRPVSNSLYYRCGIQLAAPPAYGNFIAGGGLNSTFLNGFILQWVANILPLMSVNYEVRRYTSVAVEGKRYTTKFDPIIAFSSNLASFTITFAKPHALVPGDNVFVQGVTNPAGANGVFAVDAVPSPTSIRILGGLPGAWSGDGQVQDAVGEFDLLLVDKEEVNIAVGVQVGGQAGESLPLFATHSIRRVNNGVGKNFRGRLSMSPIAESDSVDGGLVAGRRTAINTAWQAFLVTPFTNGGTDAGSQVMVDSMLSKDIAFGQPLTFTTSDPFMASITGFPVQRNTGSMVRRKPKLTQVIT